MCVCPPPPLPPAWLPPAWQARLLRCTSPDEALGVFMAHQDLANLVNVATVLNLCGKSVQREEDAVSPLPHSGNGAAKQARRPASPRVSVSLASVPPPAEDRLAFYRYPSGGVGAAASAMSSLNPEQRAAGAVGRSRGRAQVALLMDGRFWHLLAALGAQLHRPHVLSARTAASLVYGLGRCGLKVRARWAGVCWLRLCLCLPRALVLLG
jgi:hypothetical protein